MTLKGGAKCKEKLTCSLQVNLVWLSFMRAGESLEIWTFMGSFCPKHIMFQLENFRGAICHDSEGWCKIKLTCSLKNDWRILANFHASSQKSENFHLGWTLLSEAYKDLDEKLKKNHVSWHWRVMQRLKKN